ncbi:MAG: putative maturation protein [Alvestavirus fundivicinum]|uniref:Maturation protein n=1 Tax=Leviviridae sp. TaxID=2027243 RepID=A0ABY3STU9_9VIRU|nr:MAG: putative maturation protein [Leviviridae sp.]
MPRVRVQAYNPSPIGGYIQQIWKPDGIDYCGHTQNISRETEYRRCDDDTGKSTSHPLTITRITRSYSTMSGSFDNINQPISYRWKVVDLYPYMGFGLADASHGTFSLPNVAESSTFVLARTNPGRASVSLPVFIGELRELPMLLRNLGRDLLSRRPATEGSASGGKAFLQWKFGWDPLVRDLFNMLQAQAAIDRRIKELRGLYSNGGIRRKVEIARSGSAGKDNPVTFHSSCAVIVSHQRSWQTTARQWGTVRWVPTVVPNDLSDPALRKMAMDAVFGRTGNHISDIWNLLPWTWFADWFTNLGDFLDANVNRIPVMPQHLCIMRNVKTINTWDRADQLEWLKGGTGTTTLETKERFLGNSSLTASLPFLNGSQLSILGALVASSRGR